MPSQCSEHPDPELLAYRTQLEEREAAYQLALDNIRDELNRLESLSAA